MGEPLVYTVVNNSLVFAPVGVAEKISAIYGALGSSTWGEFKRRMPPDELQTIWSMLADGFEMDDEDNPVEPADDAPFCSGEIPAVADGDYPRWLQAEQGRWIPRDLLRRFGSLESSVINGPFWTIDPAGEKELVLGLTQHGFAPTRRDDLSFT